MKRMPKGLLQCTSTGEVRVASGEVRANPIVTIPKSKNWSVSSPEPNDGLIFVGETADSFVVSMSEFRVAIALDANGTFLDPNRLIAREALPQAPLVPSILRDTFTLPPLARLTVGVQAVGKPKLPLSVGAEITSLIAPIETTPRQFLSNLKDRYQLILAGISRVGVLISGGFDSRLELALVLEAVRGSGTVVDLLHIFHNEQELRIVRDISRRLGLELIVEFPERLLREWGAKREYLSIREELDLLPTWRPSIPRFAVAAAKYLKGQGDALIGYAPHSLKGRQYDLPLTQSPPQEGLFRAVGLDPTASENKENRVFRDQQQMWRIIRSIADSWDEFAQRDYLLWVLHNSYSYSHRNWPEITGGLIQPIINHSDVVAQFMGLRPEEKVETTFVLWALNELRTDLTRIEFASSTSPTAARSPIHLYRRDPMAFEQVHPDARTTLAKAQISRFSQTVAKLRNT